ncbi:MAG TPA: c-type cytochrome [Pedomonas sp.]|uniref:c-type cytochrome n=1 Tax=Pedomonas sp. TaxID=2976421 RepID=UPI002F4269B4
MLTRISLIGTVAALAAFATPAAAEGDAVAGAKVYKRCSTCHSLAPGENMMGPSLAGVFGKKAGKQDFKYSKAMAAADITWDEKTLDAYLANPTAVVKGTSMMFRVPKAEDRANLIAYLKTNPTED